MDFLVIDDDRTFSEATCLLIESEGHYVENASNPELALSCLRTGKFDAALLDLHLGAHNGLILLAEVLKLRPTMPVVMFSAEGTVKTAVQALHQGAMDFLEKPFTREQFYVVQARILRFTEMTRKIESLEAEVKESQIEAPEALLDLRTQAMQALAENLERASKGHAPVLFLGESGTGKSIAARLLHAQGDFAAKPFVTCNCRSVSKELLEAQLFGHVRGAFPGALKDQWGKVKAAEGGTLFLDEIGDLPTEIQLMLFRLLEEHEYERMGEAITRHAAIRIIAATNQDLKPRITAGSFREDLFYRLSAVNVELAPLRTRSADVLEFAGHYLRQCTERAGRSIEGFAPDCAHALTDYAWPGNLRELRNAIESAVNSCKTPRLEVGDLPEQVRQPAQTADIAPPLIGSMMSLAQLEELHIRRLLTHCTNLAQAAQVLGVDQATLYRKRKKMGIGFDSELAETKTSRA
jgi:NtrC-family two-component system response regulator AlgB